MDNEVMVEVGRCSTCWLMKCEESDVWPPHPQFCIARCCDGRCCDGLQRTQQLKIKLLFAQWMYTSNYTSYNINMRQIYAQVPKTDAMLIFINIFTSYFLHI